ncbi:MAG: hypothetical protein OXM02_04335 [Bacteroidota bacterium]|nr:hypothetical protein [Bacteroidota bacterium]
MMNTKFTPPDSGFIFWPVGTGDSTTIRISPTVHIQVDIRHLARAEDAEDPTWPVIDELAKILPKSQGKPYLSVFALTHPDQDHCQGFADLQKRVFISEMWMSPRTFREFKDGDDLCDDARAFHEEAMRRVRRTIQANRAPDLGDRIRIIGYDRLLETPEFRDFPSHFLTIPGHTITTVDGRDFRDTFAAFVHAPFREDSFGDRNDCSLAFQFSVSCGYHTGRALLMGDLSYPIIQRILERSDNESLKWNVLLAPHHCSKSVMYWEDDSYPMPGIMRHFADTALNPGYVISSSDPVPATNRPGDNPPHAKAKEQYELIVPSKFLCTQEHPTEVSPDPIVFEVGPDGFRWIGIVPPKKPLSQVLGTPGAAALPATATGFGCGHE